MKLIISAAIAFPLFLGCSEAPSDDDLAGVPLLTLPVIDSVGVEYGDEDYVFGAITGLEFMPDGGFAVLDRVSCNVRIYDDRGVHRGTIGRQGSGPGEIVQPYGLFVWSSGDIGIMDPFQGGLQRFGRDGEFLGLEMEVFQNVPLDPRMVGDTAYIAYRTAIVTRNDQLTVEAFLGRFPMTWEPSYRYISDSVPLDPSDLTGFLLEVFFYTHWTIDRENGTVYVAPFSEGEYRVLAFPLEGGDPSVMEMETVPVPKTEEEIRLERAFVAEYLSIAEGGDPMYDVQCDPWPYRLPIAGLAADGLGRLWVLRGDRDGVFFNVWDPSGGRLFDAVIPEFGSGDLRFIAGRDRMLMYRENPEDYQKIYFVEIPDAGI